MSLLIIWETIKGLFSKAIFTQSSTEIIAFVETDASIAEFALKTFPEELFSIFLVCLSAVWGAFVALGKTFFSILALEMLFVFFVLLASLV